VHYWRERNHEVDFIVQTAHRLTAIEVKSGRAPMAHPGTAAFAQAFKPQRCLLVGGDGITLEDFLSQPVQHWTGEIDHRLQTVDPNPEETLDLAEWTTVCSLWSVVLLFHRSAVYS
jgi:hypothetical protein